MIIEKTGNIFTTQSQTIVNTINCVGVMGAGIAYEFRLREPKMFQAYQQLCNKKQMEIGKLWLYNTNQENANYSKILNFPTKHDWKFPSKEEYLHKGLEKFLTTYKQKGITSIAFPLLGADKGGIHAKKSQSIMESYFKECDIDIEIWHFDPQAQDDLYENFKAIFLEIDTQTIKTQSGIRIDKVNLVKDSIKKDDINSLSGLLRVKGVGDTTIEKLFDFVSNFKKNNFNLFNYEDTIPYSL